MRTVLDGVNRSLRRAHKPWRYVVIRQGAGHGKYRIVLIPTELLGEINNNLRIVAGVSPEDYESAPN